MTVPLFLATALAGFTYVVSPGPAFLAVFALAAAEGRGSAIRFLAGHLAGDVFWSALAIAALVGANRLGPTLFDLLGLGCGGYLIYLGWRAVTTSRQDQPVPIGARRPGTTGIIFGLTNPKAYPVATAMFAAIALPYAGALVWTDAPLLLVAALIGFLPGYVIIIFAAGLPAIRSFFAKHGVTIARIVGAMFIAFGARTAWQAGRGLARR